MTEDTITEVPEKKVVLEEPLTEFATNHKLVLSDIPQEIPDDRENPGPPDKLLMIVEDDTGFAKALLEFVRKNGYKGLW